MSEQRGFDPRRRRLLHASGLLALLAGVGGYALTRRHAASAETLLGSDRRFTDRGRALVDALVDTIIPATDTPGASEAGVTDFVQMLLNDWMPDGVRQRFVDELMHFDDQVQREQGAAFESLPPAQRLELLQQLEQQAQAAASPAPLPFIVAIKSLAIFGYYTSEIGASQELELNLVPGVYHPCVAIAHGGRAPSIPRSYRLAGFD